MPGLALPVSIVQVRDKYKGQCTEGTWEASFPGRGPPSVCTPLLIMILCYAALLLLGILFIVSCFSILDSDLPIGRIW